MKHIRYIFPIFLASAFITCVEVNDAVNPGDKPIVEAYLAPGHTVSMKVSTEIPYTTDSAYAQPIEGLVISITGSDGTNYLLKEKENGVYESDTKLGEEGTIYSMQFLYRGRNISAETILPPKPTNFQMDSTVIHRVARDFSNGFQPGSGGFGPGGFQQDFNSQISLSWNNPDNVYHFVAAQSLESNPVEITILPTNEGNFPQRPPRGFNNQPTQSDASSMRSQQFEYFGRYTIILYRLNPDYAALYENTSTTTQNIATPVSTIENGLGIFTGVNADTLILNVLRSN